MPFHQYRQIVDGHFIDGGRSSMAISSMEADPRWPFHQWRQIVDRLIVNGQIVDGRFIDGGRSSMAISSMEADRRWPYRFERKDRRSVSIDNLSLSTIYMAIDHLSILTIRPSTKWDRRSVHQRSVHRQRSLSRVN